MSKKFVSSYIFSPCQPHFYRANELRRNYSVHRASVANFIDFFGTIQARIRWWEKNFGTATLQPSLLL